MAKRDKGDAEPGPPLTIRLTKISDERHRLDIVRADGSGEGAELETRSFLVHDLIHYAVESTAGLRESFWGLLASGQTFADLHDAVANRPAAMRGTISGEAGLTETIVGIYTGMAMGRNSADDTHAALANVFAVHEQHMPPWLTLDFAREVQEKLRRLRGEWKALPFGRTMELRFG
jgi:hypothetical protein